MKIKLQVVNNTATEELEIFIQEEEAKEKEERFYNKKDIKFISYSGKYPELCRGTLIIEVNKKEYKITDALVSGGKVSFSEQSGITIQKGQWRILDSKTPKELLPYVEEIVDIVNENIPQGCCGSCFDY